MYVQKKSRFAVGAVSVEFFSQFSGSKIRSPLETLVVQHLVVVVCCCTRVAVARF